MNTLIEDLKITFPKLKFYESDQFYWSPETKEIFYKRGLKNKIDKWSLLHEVGHALLDHKNYDADYMLIRLEIEAWQKAKEIASSLSIDIDEDYIQNCLDTYRDWIYRRSICPKCSNKSLQESDSRHYRCFNCHTRWRVTNSKFCRTYRISDSLSAKQTVLA